MRASRSTGSELSDELQGRLTFIAVLPQTQPDAVNYLKGAGLFQVQAVSANLGSIGVYATPTLLLIDSHGKIKSAWVGKQDEAGQRKILAALLPQPAAARPTQLNQERNRVYESNKSQFSKCCSSLFWSYGLEARRRRSRRRASVTRASRGLWAS